MGILTATPLANGPTVRSPTQRLQGKGVRESFSAFPCNLYRGKVPKARTGLCDAACRREGT